MSLSLKNRETIITGGSRGIGKVVADWLGRAGTKLNIIARKDKELSETERELKKKGFKIKTFKADVLEIEQIKSIITSLGRVDILVNCAGVQGEIGPFHEDDYNKWKKTFETNFCGTLNCISAVLPFMVRNKKGKIINFSGGGANYSRPNFSAYGVSKAAVVRLTEILADELNRFNIQINAVSPGMIKTLMIDEIIKAGPANAGIDYEQVKDKLIQGFDSPDWVAELVCFLASDASNWLTGRNISAIWDPWREWMTKGPADLDKDMYVLRRIDGRNFIKATK